MFRFIHSADLHIDSPLEGLETQEGAPVDLIRGATRRAVENLFDLALDEAVDFLVIAGDIYDGDWKDYNTGLFFRKQLARLNDQGIPVYLISGNHDAASLISKRLTLPDHVHTFSTRTAESMEVPNLPVVIHGRGFPNRAVPENLAREYPAAVSGKFNIGLLHTSLTGRPGHDVYAPCSKQDLMDKGYHYWALGHIHQPEIINEYPWIVFAGNCQGRHIREEGARGCRLVQVNDLLEVESTEQRDLDVVRWRTVEVDLTGVDAEGNAYREIQGALSKAMAGAESRMSAVRVILTGETPLHGKLLLEAGRLRAELEAMAQDLGREQVWIEQVKLQTRPVYRVELLAERDELTRVVLATLKEDPPEWDSLPPDIKEMLEVLPPEIRSEIEREWTENRAAVMNEVQGIILESLQTQGEQHE